jgi:ribose transport system ATP-binding protein
VLAHCDRVTILRDGATVAARDAAQLDERELISLITGRPPRPGSRDDSRIHGHSVLTLQGLRGPGFGPVSCTVGEGEIVALTGLADAGHRFLAQAMFGLVPSIAGSMTLGGAPFAPVGPRSAIEAGVAFLPSDRRGEGLADLLSARENLNMCPPTSPLRRLRHAEERRRAGEVMARFNITPPDPEREVATFSGGNQQKLLLARCLTNASRLLVLNDPTGAVDVGAKFEIYELLRQRCRDEGVAALVVTSDFEEAAQLCDRALVMRRGRVTAELSGERLDVSSITEAAFRASP